MAPPAGEELRSAKNVQIIDGATNCTYSIYAFTDEQFALLFPEEGQDVEFIEDVMGRLSPEQQGARLLRGVDPAREKARCPGDPRHSVLRVGLQEGVLPVEAGKRRRRSAALARRLAPRT